MTTLKTEYLMLAYNIFAQIGREIYGLTSCSEVTFDVEVRKEW